MREKTNAIIHNRIGEHKKPRAVRLKIEAIDIFEGVTRSLFKNINSGKMIKDVIHKEVPEEKLDWALMVYENWMESQDLPVEEE